MSKLVLDIFQKAVERFVAAEEAVRVDEPLPCGCQSPGSRLECRDCCYCEQLGLLIQNQLHPTPEKVFPERLSLPETSCPYPSEVRQKAVELYAQGYTLAEIRQLTGGMNHNLISQLARQAGLPKRTAQYPEELKQTCLELYSVGKTTMEIQNLTGVPVYIVRVWA
ncbi:MAG TPA: hypothetical protein VIQ31_16680, partial [Phormidium sp.]